MRGHKHKLRLIGERAAVGGTVPLGQVYVDDEGRWRSPIASAGEGSVAVEEVLGFIGFVKVKDRPAGVMVDTAAHLPKGTTVTSGDDLVAETGDPNLDGRYEIIEVQPGPAMVRVLLKRAIRPQRSLYPSPTLFPSPVLYPGA